MVASPAKDIVYSFGGYNYDPNVTNKTESWNGTNWTELNDMNTARYNLGGFGPYTAALGVAGEIAPGGRPAQTEEWNGTNWTEVADVSTVRQGMAGAGTTTAGLVAGGITDGPAKTAATEEWNAKAPTTITFTTS